MGYIHMYLLNLRLLLHGSCVQLQPHHLAELHDEEEALVLAFSEVVAAVLVAQVFDGVVAALNHLHFSSSQVVVEVVGVALQALLTLQVEVYDVIIELLQRKRRLLLKLDQHVYITATDGLIGLCRHEGGQDDILRVGYQQGVISGVSEGLVSVDPSKSAKYYDYNKHLYKDSLLQPISTHLFELSKNPTPFFLTY